MDPDTPIACSLSADELPERLAELRAIGRDALLTVDRDRRAALPRRRARTRARLEAIIAAESRCCSFLNFDLRDQTNELVLRSVRRRAPSPLAFDLVDAFAAGKETA